MQDQKEKLNKNGYFRVESFNSDLISQVEKEAVLKKLKMGKLICYTLVQKHYSHIQSRQ